MEVVGRGVRARRCRRVCAAGSLAGSHDGIGDAERRQPGVHQQHPAATLTFPATTLNGTNQTITSTLAFDIGDARDPAPAGT